MYASRPRSVDDFLAWILHIDCILYYAISSGSNFYTGRFGRKIDDSHAFERWGFIIFVGIVRFCGSYYDSVLRS